MNLLQPLPQPSSLYRFEPPSSVSEEAHVISTVSHILKDFELVVDSLQRVCTSCSNNINGEPTKFDVYMKDTVSMGWTMIETLPSRSPDCGRRLITIISRIYNVYAHALECHSNQLEIYSLERTVRLVAEAFLGFSRRWRLLPSSAKDYRPRQQSRTLPSFSSSFPSSFVQTSPAMNTLGHYY